MNGDTKHRLPGDPHLADEIVGMLRVDHAGEYGAMRIYQGQLDVLGQVRSAAAIRRMSETEQRHLAHFETLLRERRVRPTLLQPLWSVAGYALGAATALLWRFGEPVRDFIERRLMLVTSAIAAALVGGFLMLRYL